MTLGSNAAGSGHPLRVVLVTGAPGVGKTDTARHLAALYDEQVAVIDTDSLASIHPFSIDEAFNTLVEVNLHAVLPNYVAWGASIVIISGVAREGALFDVIERACDRVGATLAVYVLAADVDEVRRRILGDAKVQDARGRLEWLHLVEEFAAVGGGTAIDTSRRSAREVAAEIYACEARRPPDPVLQTAAPSAVTVTAAVAHAAVVEALEAAEVPLSHARAVADRLIDNELDGHQSHGLLRLPDYLAQLRAGVVDGAAEPVVELIGGGAVVDGRDCLGAVALPVLARTIIECSSGGPAVVALRRSGHLGTLRWLAREVTSAGIVLVGFVNYQGGGQKVLPHGGASPRLASDPIVVAIPMPDGPPVVVDLSTSSTSEGAVRVAALAGRPVAAGHLLDSQGRSVTDPTRLYLPEASVGLAPLGGPSGHKGFALGVVVEALAGAVAGGGIARPGVVAEGNAALFLGLPADLFRNQSAVFDDLVRFEAHVSSSPPVPGSPPVRLPGRRRKPRSPTPDDLITVPAATWRAVEQAASGGSES